MTIYKQEQLLAKVDRDFNNLKELVTNSKFGSNNKEFERAIDLQGQVETDVLNTNMPNASEIEEDLNDLFVGLNHHDTDLGGTIADISDDIDYGEDSLENQD